MELGWGSQSVGTAAFNLQNATSEIENTNIFNITRQYGGQ
jgi:hypothetical protein